MPIVYSRGEDYEHVLKLPEGVRVKSAAAAETLVASGTFVALFAITGTVLLDLF